MMVANRKKAALRVRSEGDRIVDRTINVNSIRDSVSVLLF